MLLKQSRQRCQGLWGRGRGTRTEVGNLESGPTLDAFEDRLTDLPTMWM